MIKIFLINAMKNLYYMIPVYVFCVYILGMIKKSKHLNHLNHIAFNYLKNISFFLVKMFFSILINLNQS